MRICIILGTRPEIIKMSPIIRACKKQNIDFYVVHTGQHYSYNMDKIFFKELKLPEADYNLEVGSGTQAEQTARALERIENVLLKERTDVVLVEGDTNTVLAGALAASKLHIKVGHVEAGLRSYFRFMPEEINRILTDHCSDFLFAPTKKAKKILEQEGIKSNVFVTGNTIVDAVIQNSRLAERSSIIKKLGLKKDFYALLTAHRFENVDFKERLKGIIKGLEMINKEFGLKIVYPIHPRTRKNLERFKIKIPGGIELIEPVGYIDFLKLEENAKIVLTDSGGVQEESCVLRVPCVTLRENTERLETIEVGANILAGTNPKKMLKSARTMLKRKRNWKNPFGDGKAAERIIKILSTKLNN